jgi:glycosyltransferase involved in cell wall biosynthesis
MKVVQIGTGLSPLIPAQDIAAGREQYIYWLAEYLSRKDCDVFAIDIRGRKAQQEKRVTSGICFLEIQCSPLLNEIHFPFLKSVFDHFFFTSRESIFGLLALFPLSRLLRNENIAIIHTHQRETALVAVLLNKLMGNKVVVLYTPHLVTGINTRLRKFIHMDEIFALKYVDHIVALNPSHKSLLISEYKLNPAKITSIVGGGAATDEIHDFINQNPGLPHQSNIILCVGIINERKNQMTAVMAISKVVSAHPEIQLVFTGHIGDPVYLESIRSFILKNGISDNVKIKGLVSKKELYTLYRQARIFLFPTTAETQSAVIREALCFGLPAIASNIGAHTDIISLKKNSAILLDPYDVDGFAYAILGVLNDSSLWLKMSQAATELSETLTYSHVASETIDLYNRLIKVKNKSNQ